jgi:hypothetical protein
LPTPTESSFSTRRTRRAFHAWKATLRYGWPSCAHHILSVISHARVCSSIISCLSSHMHVSALPSYLVCHLTCTCLLFPRGQSTLHPLPFRGRQSTLHPLPFEVDNQPCTLYLSRSTINLAPSTLSRSTSKRLNPKSMTRNSLSRSTSMRLGNTSTTLSPASTR